MARRTRIRERAALRGVNTSSDALENIDELISSGGQISLGQMSPIPCAAIANDEHNCLAMLQRRNGESLRDLLVRLDAAIAIAWNEERFIDEINSPNSVSRRP
ncbi:MAG: hypothetical protein WCO67_15735 [Betaproteobacteria bacterium]